MSSDFSETIGAIFFSILILSLLVDIVLSGTWNRMYFTSGLPIFIMQIPVSRRHINIPLSSRFEKQFRSKWTSALVFREIDLNTYGFREKFFDFLPGGLTARVTGGWRDETRPRNGQNPKPRIKPSWR